MESLHETFQTDLQLVPLENPAILEGTIEYLGKQHTIVYNELLLTNSTVANYRFVYIPNPGMAATILLYMFLDTLHPDGNTITFTKTLRQAASSDLSNATVRLTLSASAISTLMRYKEEAEELEQTKTEGEGEGEREREGEREGKKVRIFSNHT